MNEITTKIAKMNWDFILDNYLDERLWGHKKNNIEKVGKK